MCATLHLPQNISAVQEVVNAGTSHWFTLEGPGIEYTGSENINHGWINAYGTDRRGGMRIRATALRSRTGLICSVFVQNVSWRNIWVFNVSFPIFVTQSYYDNDTSEAGSGAESAAMMEDFSLVDFAGTMNTYHHGAGSCVTDPCCMTALPGLKHTETIIIECAKEDSCKGFSMENTNVIPQSLDAPSVVCMNATAVLNPDLGVECKNGTMFLNLDT